MEVRISSDVGDILLDVVLQFGGVGSVDGVDDLAVEGDDDLRLAGRLELGQVQGLDLLLVHQDDVYSLLELVDDVGLQVLVEGHQSLAVPTPGRVNVDDHQLGVLLTVEVGEVVSVSDGGGEFYLFGRHQVTLSYKYRIFQNCSLKGKGIGVYGYPTIMFSQAHPKFDDLVLLEVEVSIDELHIVFLPLVSEDLQHLQQNSSFGLHHLGLVQGFGLLDQGGVLPFVLLLLLL